MSNTQFTCRFGKWARALAISLLLGLVAPVQAQSESSADPFESFNRAVFQFNDTIDRAVLKPVAQFYADVVPETPRLLFRNFVSNLLEPWNAVNNLLQGKPVAHGRLGIKAHPEQQGRPGHLWTDRALEHPGGSAAGVDAQFLEARIEQRPRSCDTDVGGQSQIETRADSRPVDRGDRRQAAAPHRHETGIDAFEAFARCGAER